MYHAALTFVGQNVGARKYDRVRKSIVYSVLVVTAVGLSVGLVMYVFGEPLLGIYAPHNPEVIAAGMTRLGILGLSYFLCGLMEVGSGVMRGFGKSIAPMIVSLLGSCVFRIAWIYTIFEMNPTLTMLYISYPISWIVTGAVHFLFCFVTLQRRVREERAAMPAVKQPS